jgi:SAM-dependent methyltransferase
MNSELADTASGEIGAAVAAAVAVDAGMAVLEIGTGTVGAALAQGVEAKLVEAGTGPLPFHDETFDRVLSALGATQADDADAAVQEMVRVCRSGGEIVLATQAGEGAPPWGTEGHVRRSVGGQLVLAIERASVAGEDYLIVIGHKPVPDLRPNV